MQNHLIQIRNGDSVSLAVDDCFFLVPCLYYSGLTRIRTGTLFRAADFESAASTNSAMRPVEEVGLEPTIPEGGRFTVC